MEPELNQLTKLKLNENQIKIIKDKYLKNSPTIEHWLKGVCHNIALGDLLYSDEVDEEDVFLGVNCKKISYESKNNIAGFYLLHHGLKTQDEIRQNFKKFLDNLESINNENPNIISETEEKFYDLLSSFKFLPNSPTLMNAGRELQQLSACYVLPVEDSIDGIYSSIRNMALIHKSGGGTGFSFSRLRPSNDIVKTTKGISSGPLSFMQVFDKSTDVVKQGGTRRGANMGILHYNHPDILDFIDMKKEPGIMENFNLSVTVDEKFMEAVKNNEDYELINPRSKKVTKKISAKKVWEKLVERAWETGDPGIIFLDRINNTSSNATPHLGEIESTNPCGEQPLLPYESCNLGSINLSKFVKNSLTSNAEIDYEGLRECVHLAVHFLDNVIDVNRYPLAEIEEITKKTRRIGLGVMGWAETLVMLGIPYGSSESLKKAEEVMKFINMSALRASEKLAEERGIFPTWRRSIYDKESPYYRGQEFFPRHSTRTTIAPTGTIGIAAGLQGAGIEPFFAIVYIRYNAAGIDALKKGESPKKEDMLFEVNPFFEQIAKDNDYFGFKKEELYLKINENHKTLIGIKEIPEEIQKLFPTSHDLSPEKHVFMQCAFQKYTDNAVSKTVNLKNDATIEDVEKVYNLIYENNAKGVTVYRDGSKQFQILNLDDKSKDKDKDKDKEKKEIEKRKVNLPEFADYYLIHTGHGPIHIHINYNKEGPTKVFANISPAGTEISGLSTALAIILSKYFELGGDPVKILKHLNSVKSESPYGFGTNRIDSIPHALSVALKRHLIKTGKMKLINNSNNSKNSENHQKPNNSQKPNFENSIESEDIDENSKLYCPNCFSSNVGMVSGCQEPTCFDCGYSKC